MFNIIMLDAKKIGRAISSSMFNADITGTLSVNIVNKVVNYHQHKTPECHDDEHHQVQYVEQSVDFSLLNQSSI